MKNGFKRIQGAINVMLLAKHVLIFIVIVVSNVQIVLCKLKRVELMNLRIVYNLALMELMKVTDFVGSVTKHVSHALGSKITIVTNARLGFCKTKLQYLRILKNVYKLALKELMKITAFVSSAITHARHALVAEIIIVLNVQMNIFKRQIQGLRILKNVCNLVLLGLNLVMMELV